MSLVPRQQVNLEELARQFEQLANAPGDVQRRAVEEATNRLNPLTIGQITALLENKLGASSGKQMVDVVPAPQQENNQFAALVRGLNLAKFDMVDMDKAHASEPQSQAVASVKPVVKNTGIA